MLFSSLVFLYCYLPLTVVGYYLLNPKYRNNFLLLASFLFFAWGGVSLSGVLLVSLFINFFTGKAIASAEGKSKKIYLTVGLVLNILLLGIFKYTVFVLTNINAAFLDTTNSLAVPEIVLPIGISFYTFQAMSYLIDLYRDKNMVEKSFFNLSLYITFFPQLIAGPIVKYHDVAKQIKNRAYNRRNFVKGSERFVLGLAKKVLVANQFGQIADIFFNMPAADLSAVTAWIGIIAYTLQIYFDFAGYSDMAIGLGRMFGFRFHENFNLPYISKSIREFWTRWHMSLSGWFRDYLYVPLGGNREGKTKTYRNLFIVFVCTGFWHGAEWTFLFWGIWHGFFIVMERLLPGKGLEVLPKWIRNIYVLAVVVIGWVFFRAANWNNAVNYFKALFSFTDAKLNSLDWYYLGSFISTDNFLMLLLAIAGASGLLSNFYKKVKTKLLVLYYKRQNKRLHYFEAAEIVVLLFLFVLSTMNLIANTYNPFIYFRF